MQELQNIPSRPHRPSSPKRTSDTPWPTGRTTNSRPLQASKLAEERIQPSSQAKSQAKSQEPLAKGQAQVSITLKDETIKLALRSSNSGGACPICSIVNESAALTCMVCSNVLKPKFVPGFWRCKSTICKDSEYVNAGDVGLCGVCGARKHL